MDERSVVTSRSGLQGGARAFSRGIALIAVSAVFLVLSAAVGAEPAYAYVGDDVPLHNLPNRPEGADDWRGDGFEGWIVTTIDGYEVHKDVILTVAYGSGDLVIPETIHAEVFPGGDGPGSTGPSYMADLQITTIAAETFLDNEELTSVTLPDSLLRMGHRAFDGCTNLRTVVFEGEELQYIPDECFANCTSLTSFTIKPSVEQIGYRAFADCTSLTTVKIMTDSSELYFIRPKAFSGCSALTQITIPYTVSQIDYEAFKGCSSLANVYFKYADLSKLMYLGNDAFNGCSSLKEIELPFDDDAYPCLIGNHVFYGCTALEKVGFRRYPKAEGSNYDCFSQCTNLKFVVIKFDIFEHLSADGLGMQYLSHDPVFLLVRQAGTRENPTLEIVKIYTDATWGTVTAAGSVDLVIPAKFVTYPFTKIDRCAAFTPYVYNHTEMPYSPNSFGEDGLRSVSFEEGCQITEIGEMAFMKCQYLESFTIPPSVETIGQMAFMTCERLASVDFQTTQLTEIPWQCFRESGLESLTLPEGLLQIDGRAFALCGDLGDVHFPKSISVIYDTAFLQCDGWLSFYMPDVGNQDGVEHPISFLRDDDGGQGHYSTDSGYFWDALGPRTAPLYYVTCGSWFEQKIVIEKNLLRGSTVYIPVDISEDNTSVVINVDTGNHPVYNTLPHIPTLADDSTRWYHVFEERDFTIDTEHSSCTNAGTATVVLKGDGEKFTGTRTITFTIDPADITHRAMLGHLDEPETGFLWDDMAWQPTGSFYIPALNPENPSANYDLQEADYTASYGTNIDAGADAGSITITGKGNFTGSETFYFDILQQDLANASVADIPDQYYTGDEIKPSPKVTLKNRNGGEIPLSVRNGDYTLDYVDNINPGPATIIIEHVEGSNVKGSTTARFNIIPVDLDDEDLEVDPVDDQEYTGSGIEPDLSVWTPDGNELVQGKAYSVTWENNVEVGTATATLQGIAPYSSGAAEVTFEIVPRKVTITVDNASKGKDEADPVFTGTVDRLVSEGDLGQIEYFRTNNDEALGTYVGVLDARYTPNRNYEVSVVKGDFTIAMLDYKVSFNANVPASASTTCAGSMEDQNLKFSERKALSKNTFTLPGYDFNGWNTKADGSGDSYADEAQVQGLSEHGGTVTLYAQWSGKPYTIEYWSDDEGSQKHVQTAYFDRPGKLDVYSDRAFGWDSGGKTLHGWRGRGFGSFLEDGDDFVNLCGAPDADGNVSDPVIVAEWLSNGQIAITVTKDGAPQAGLEECFTLVSDGITFKVPFEYQDGRYSFDPSKVEGHGGLPAQLPSGTYELKLDASDYPSASTSITYGDAYAVSAVFDYYTVSLVKDPVYGNACEVGIGGDAVAIEPGKVVALDGGELSITTTVDEGYRFAGYTAVGVAPAWEDSDPSKATQTITVQGKADITARVEPIDYSVTVVGGTADVATAHVDDTVTITANDPEPGKAFVQWAHVEDVDYVNASSTSTTFTMPAGDVTVEAVFKPIVIQPITDKVCTGLPIEPFDEVKVSLEGVDMLLTADDYEVSFSNNVEVGTATVTVTMKDPRAGSATATFQIVEGDIVYRLVSAPNGPLDPKTDPVAEFVFKRSEADETTLDHLQAVLVDGRILSGSDYETRRGSVVITLTPSYLKSLAQGEHTLVASFDDGKGQAEFTIASAPDPGPAPTPDTGDGKGLTAALLALAALGLGLLALGARRRIAGK